MEESFDREDDIGSSVDDDKCDRMFLPVIKPIAYNPGGPTNRNYAGLYDEESDGFRPDSDQSPSGDDFKRDSERESVDPRAVQIHVDCVESFKETIKLEEGIKRGSQNRKKKTIDSWPFDLEKMGTKKTLMKEDVAFQQCVCARIAPKEASQTEVSFGGWFPQGSTNTKTLAGSKTRKKARKQDWQTRLQPARLTESAGHSDGFVFRHHRDYTQYIEDYRYMCSTAFSRGEVDVPKWVPTHAKAPDPYLKISRQKSDLGFPANSAKTTSRSLPIELTGNSTSSANSSSCREVTETSSEKLRPSNTTDNLTVLECLGQSPSSRQGTQVKVPWTALEKETMLSIREPTGSSSENEVSSMTAGKLSTTTGMLSTAGTLVPSSLEDNRPVTVKSHALSVRDPSDLQSIRDQSSTDNPPESFDFSKALDRVVLEYKNKPSTHRVNYSLAQTRHHNVKLAPQTVRLGPSRNLTVPHSHVAGRKQFVDTKSYMDLPTPRAAVNHLRDMKAQRNSKPSTSQFTKDLRTALSIKAVDSVDIMSMIQQNPKTGGTQATPTCHHNGTLKHTLRPSTKYLKLTEGQALSNLPRVSNRPLTPVPRLILQALNDPVIYKQYLARLRDASDTIQPLLASDDEATSDRKDFKKTVPLALRDLRKYVGFKTAKAKGDFVGHGSRKTAVVSKSVELNGIVEKPHGFNLKGKTTRRTRQTSTT